MGVIPLHEAIIKCGKKPNPVVSLPSNNANNLTTVRSQASTTPPINTMTNFLNPTSSNGRSFQCQRQASLPNLMSSTRVSVSRLDHSDSSNGLTDLSIRSKPITSNTLHTPGASHCVIRRNCSYTSVSRSFPYYIPVPSSAKLNSKPKRYQSFVRTTIEQDQNVLSPSGSEGSSRDSGFNSDSSSPVPPIVSSDIDQLLDEIATLDDIN